MARPPAADGGTAPPIWRVDANILNRKSRTAENRWFSRVVVGRGAKQDLNGQTLQRYEAFHKDADLEFFFRNPT